MLNAQERRNPKAILAAVENLPESARGRSRDLAARLGISEAELLAARTGVSPQSRIVRLVEDCGAILREVPSLGTVLALTRNEAAVHEKLGPYGEVRLFETAGGVFERNIDLRFFLQQWRFAFAVEEGEGDDAPKRSLQFFSKDGKAVHKIHLKDYSDHGAFTQLVDRFAASDQVPGIEVEAPTSPPADPSDDDVDLEALRTGWQNLGDVHRFNGLLRDIGSGREQAFRLVGRDYAWRVATDSLPRACELAVEAGTSIMIFVPNQGCIQIHTGPIQRLKTMGPWWNIMDPGFTLHMRSDLVASAWVVRKPTIHGIITSLELFDADRRLIAMMFGERARARPETASWRRISEALQHLETRH